MRVRAKEIRKTRKRKEEAYKLAHKGTATAAAPTTAQVARGGVSARAGAGNGGRATPSGTPRQSSTTPRERRAPTATPPSGGGSEG